MNLLVSSSFVLLAISLCNAKTDTVLDQTSASTTPAEATIKAVRSTDGTAVPNSVGHVPAQLNSLSSSQDGAPKQSPAPHNQNINNKNNNNNAITLSNHAANIVHVNGQPNHRQLPPSHSHHQLQQYVRAFTSLPKSPEYNQPLPHIKSNEILQSHGPIYSHITNGGQHGVPNQPPGSTSASGGYILSVNTENGQTLTSSGPTPVIMQYLPQNQHSSGIQYLQLIPTRPLIVPISPYLSTFPAQHQPPSPQQHHQQQQHHAQHHHNQQPLHHPQHPPQYLGTRPSGPPTPPIHPYSNYAAGQSYLSAGQIYQHTPNQSPHSTNHYPVFHQAPNGGFAAASSSAPVVSFFRPHTGIQLVNGPVDMSLNTNEYIPIQSDNAYKMRRA